MKTVFKNLATSFLLVLALLFSSCQSEFEELPNADDQTSITANSATAALIKQASSNDGSFDNIVDGSSCIAIQFPYTVKINGLEITIDSMEDLELIEKIFDELDDDNDILDIIFPINITLADFTEVTINDIEDLRELASDCIEGGDDDDIECIDFVYPLTFFKFDVNNQQTGSVVVGSDRELRRFFHNLGDDDVVSLDFPVQLELYNGEKITVENNAELANALRSAKDACDEDDDDDYNDDDFNKERLDNYLVECPFLVRDVKRNNQDQTDRYFEYAMNFKENGEVRVFDRQGNVLNGTWTSRVGAERVLLTLSFDAIVDFSLEWFVYEIEDGKIKLFAGDGNKIIMKRNCDFITNVPDRLRTILKECSWDIEKLMVNGDPIEGLEDYKFKFKTDNKVSLLKDDGTESQGTWEVKLNEQNVLVMALTMDAETNLNLEWPVLGIYTERIVFELPGTAPYQLIIERDCDEVVVCSEAYIADVIQDCKWKITNEDGTFFQDLKIDFSNSNIHVHNPNNTVVDEGNWELFGTTLRFNDLSMTLANYIGDWNVIECDDDFFKLKRGEEIIKLTKMCD
ncbi:hypothetical protein [Cellulophaga sp. Hel_I_12]|uniref:hypothetical protein n=1 Tax=Cellulophaga sp. Hel_I_12 TaxID=1249972 RepID=UPI000689FA37|nr:hypothetical protein [Cellulophaga sp. Hel_I_12]